MSIYAKPRGRPPKGSNRITNTQEAAQRRELKKRKKLIKEVYRLHNKFVKWSNKSASYYICNIIIPEWVNRHLNDPAQITENTLAWFQWALLDDKMHRMYARLSARDLYHLY